MMEQFNLYLKTEQLPQTELANVLTPVTECGTYGITAYHAVTPRHLVEDLPFDRQSKVPEQHTGSTSPY